MIWGTVQSPCKDCKDRAVGCHATCERYAKFKAEGTKQRKTFYDKQLILSAGPRWQETKSFVGARQAMKTRVFKDHKK